MMSFPKTFAFPSKYAQLNPTLQGDVKQVYIHNNSTSLHTHHTLPINSDETTRWYNSSRRIHLADVFSKIGYFLGACYNPVSRPGGIPSIDRDMNLFLMIILRQKSDQMLDMIRPKYLPRNSSNRRYKYVS